MTRRGPQLLAALAIAASGCDEQETGWQSEPGETITERSAQDNGIRLNGIRLNGFRVNGIRLNGIRLNGDEGSGDYIEITGMALANGTAVVDSWLSGSSLQAEIATGQIVGGSGLVGATLDFGVMEGKKPKHQKQLRINGVTPLSAGSDVLLYAIDVRDSNGPWEPLCIDGSGNATQAILLGDLWDPLTGDRLDPPVSDAVTFACRDAALGKCTEWGYRPWASAGGTALRDHHQACVRMVRADYCGDGVSHTLEGTAIHVLDQLGIQLLDLGVSYTSEAEWDEHGATCLNYANARVPNPGLSCQLPSCSATAFGSGGVIQSGKILSGP